MLIDPNWSFLKAIREVSTVHKPWGHTGPIQRNRLIESWGQLVGRKRALREFDHAVKRYGSLTALGRNEHITVPTLRALREFYAAMPVEPGGGRLARGDQLGKWHLVERIGSGGNAEVWRARTHRRDAAIKVLRRARGRGLARFRAEIAVLEQLENARGVLPMLDVHCPERIAADEHVWLALPIAMPIRDAAAEASAPAIIEGVAQIADTMATLHAAGISHRDLKPENLYKWNGRWVVSDFGIASFPGKAELTVGVDKLGPVHYIAPEMLLDPENADGSAADVYSLAKTLWVLACGQKYPPPGEQRVDVVEVRLEEWVDSDGIDDLNSLLEACTQHSPAQRPSMQEMAQSLSEWLAD